MSGGPEVKDHKWVIHEELKDAGKEPLEPGTQAVVNADHMEGMKGATAVIDSAEQTTVYMVDFTTTTGEEVKNHKWVTESELAPYNRSFMKNKKTIVLYTMRAIVFMHMAVRLSFL